MRFEQQSITLRDVERHRAEARAMQSREVARLARRLFGFLARLPGRVATPHRDTADRRTGVRGTEVAAVPANVRRA